MLEQEYGLISSKYSKITVSRSGPLILHSVAFFLLIFNGSFFECWSWSVPALEIMIQPSVDSTQLTWGEKGKTRKEIYAIHRASLYALYSVSFYGSVIRSQHLTSREVHLLLYSLIGIKMLTHRKFYFLDREK